MYCPLETTNHLVNTYLAQTAQMSFLSKSTQGAGIIDICIIIFTEFPYFQRKYSRVPNKRAAR